MALGGLALHSAVRTTPPHRPLKALRPSPPTISLYNSQIYGVGNAFSFPCLGPGFRASSRGLGDPPGHDSHHLDEVVMLFPLQRFR